MRGLIGCLGVVMVMLAAPAWAETQYFQSPSGNIVCVIEQQNIESVRCDLGVDRQSYTARPAACQGRWGRSFGVAETGMGFLNCVTDLIRAPRDAVVLPYGVALDVDGIICRSETTGMTCTNRDGGGFSVRRAEQRIF